jgi:hypothetical protein
LQRAACTPPLSRCRTFIAPHQFTIPLEQHNPGQIVPAPQQQTTDVRYGSKADIALGPRHVRFTPKSGHC